jgi:hypothetical protein
MFGRRETARISIGTRRVEAYRAGMDNSPGRRLDIGRGQGWVFRVQQKILVFGVCILENGRSEP